MPEMWGKMSDTKVCIPYGFLNIGGELLTIYILQFIYKQQIFTKFTL